MFARDFLLLAQVFVFTLINFIFAVRIYLTIFYLFILIPTIFLLSN